MLIFLILTTIVAVAHCRVTFAHSEVLQQTDLDAVSKSAKFKCDNGCYIYSDSKSADMWITDGTVDYNNFFIMGAPDKASGPEELFKWNNYKLEYRGAGNPPTFVFYAVDKNSPNLDTTVVAGNNAAGYLADTKTSRRFTVLNSVDPQPVVAFTGEYATGYPRIYATGFDAVNEADCRPVYQARSQESALNSWLSIPSPVLTVDKGPAVTKSASVIASGAFDKKVPNSSLIYMSPGYVGCSYIHDQIYSSATNQVLDTFSAEVKSLDLAAALSIPTANEAVHVTVNNVKTDLYGTDPLSHHYEDDRFDITISWIRINPTTSFAIQFDLGVTKYEATTDQTQTTTTSKVGSGNFALSSLILVTFAVMS